jgi:phosphorylcholine metabolism protein LicD
MKSFGMHTNKNNKPIEWEKALFEICSILQHCNIKYIVDQGTLLGIHRDNDFIAWDTDIDLAIIEQNTNEINLQIEQLINELSSRNIRFDVTKESFFIIFNKVPVGITIYKKEKSFYTSYFIRVIFRYKIISKIGYKVYLYTKGIYKYKFVRNGMLNYLVKYIIKWKLNNSILNKIFNNLFFIEKNIIKIPDELFSQTKNITFRGGNYNVPLLLEEYLICRYGREWKIPNKDFVCHDDDKSIATK